MPTLPKPSGCEIPQPTLFRVTDSLCPAWLHGSATLLVAQFSITKATPRGVWIDLYGTKKFVLLSARKKFACLTLEEAKESFKARKAKHLEILQHKVECVKELINAANDPATEFKLI